MTKSVILSKVKHLLQSLIEILRLKALNDVDYILDCFKIIDFSQWQIKFADITISLQSLNETMKNSCCLSDSEFTSLGLNLVTVFSRRCFSFLSNVLSFFFAIKKKEYLVRGLGLHKPQYILVNNFHKTVIKSLKIYTLQTFGSKFLYF